MRTNAIVRIILFSLAILVLVTILGVGIAARSLSFDWNTPADGTASSTGTADAGTVRKLDIEWAAGSITIQPADVTEITITETGATEGDPMVWLVSGDTLKVSYTKKLNVIHFGNTPSKDLLIEVPHNWICDKLEVEAAAANLTAEHLTMTKVDFDGAAGVFEFVDCIVEDLDIDTASGDIRFTGTLTSLDCDAASADCEFILANCPSRIEMDMASGDLDLTLPESCGFAVSLDTLSGNFDSDFFTTASGKNHVFGDGSCRIDISAMSGDVYIHKQDGAWNCDH